MPSSKGRLRDKELRRRRQRREQRVKQRIREARMESGRRPAGK